jgi:hypothetical protein
LSIVGHQELRGIVTRYMQGCDYASVDGNPGAEFPVLHDAGYRVIGLRAAHYGGERIVADGCFARDAVPARAAGMTVISCHEVPRRGARSAAAIASVTAPPGRTRRRAGYRAVVGSGMAAPAS